MVRAVPLGEWPHILSAAIVAAGVEVGVRALPLPRLAKLLGVRLDSEGSPAVGDRPCAQPSTRARRRLQATYRVLRHWPFGGTCLRQALVLGQRLRRLDPVLHVGVAKVEGDVRAHAWLEIDGAVVDPIGGAAFYQRLEAIPAREAR